MKRLARFMLLLLAVMTLALAVETCERIAPVVEYPEVQGSQLAALALHPTIVRVHGQLAAEPDPSPSPQSPGDILLERVIIDSGRYPRPTWKTRGLAFLLHQKVPSNVDYDMVSPPRVDLDVSSVVVALQTEDIELSCWPPTLEVEVPAGSAYPADVQKLMLPSLPDPLPVVGNGHVAIRTFKPGENVMVIGEVAKDGDLTVLRPPDHAPFVVSALAYEDIQARLRSEQRTWENLTVGLVLIGLLIGFIALRARSPLSR